MELRENTVSKDEKASREKILQSLISSFRIENIHISKAEAEKLLKKVNVRLKKQAS